MTDLSGLRKIVIEILGDEDTEWMGLHIDDLASRVRKRVRCVEDTDVNSAIWGLLARREIQFRDGWKVALVSGHGAPGSSRTSFVH